MSPDEDGVGHMSDRKTYVPWTARELELIADRTLTASHLATLMPHTESAISTKRSRMGIVSDNPNRTFWTKEDRELLRDYSLSPKQLAAMTGHPLGSVYAKRASMNLPTPSDLARKARKAADEAALRAETRKYFHR